MLIDSIVLGGFLFLMEILTIINYQKATNVTEIRSATFLLVFINLAILLGVYFVIRQEILFKREHKLILEYWNLGFEKSEINSEREKSTLTERQKDLLEQREIELKKLTQIVKEDLDHLGHYSNKIFCRKKKESIKRKLYNNISANKEEYYLIKSNNITR